MKRRKFIKTASSGILAPVIIKDIPINECTKSVVSPMVENDHVLVLIYLKGGNDGLNTVVPIDQLEILRNARGNILIDESKLLALDGAANLKLHPSLTGFQTLFNEKKLSIVQSVGYSIPSFSHGISSNIWASGKDEEDYLDTGWIGRYLSELHPDFPDKYPNAKNPDPLAIQFGGNLPLLFQGKNAQMSMVFGTEGNNIFREWPIGLDDPIDNSHRGRKLNHIRTVSRLSKSYADSIASTYTKGSNASNYPTNNNLGEYLRVIARLLKGGIKTKIFLLSIDGFDTHNNQVDGNNKLLGTHANLLQTLGDAVLAFQRDLEGLNISDRVLGMTFSEFGRRIKSNQTLGTEHGAAAPMFLFGNKVNGGIFGSNPKLPNMIHNDDNLPMQYDFRSIYTSVLKDWFCVEDNELRKILLKSYPYLPLIKSDCASVSVKDLIDHEEQLSIIASPNPMAHHTNIIVKVKSGHARLQVYDSSGRVINIIFNGKLEEGTHSFYLENKNFQAGNYYIQIQQGAAQKIQNLVIANS